MSAPTVEAGDSKKHMRWTHFCRLLGFLGVAFFFVSAFTPLPNMLSRRIGSPSRVEPAEAIVVLGAGVWPGGVLSDNSMRRALQGILLQRKGLAPLLIFSGPPRDEGPAESEIRAKLAQDLGISPGVILTEVEARTTREEAVRSGMLLQERGLRRILLVTDAHHMVRARVLFEQAGFEVLPAPAVEFSDRTSSPEGRLRLMRRIVQELSAWLYYRVAGYL